MRLRWQIYLLTYATFHSVLKEIHAVIYSGGKILNSLNSYSYQNADFMIEKVSFTQRGYIQFLKYTAVVPPLRDYTFCIWVRSDNLTHNHPLLSYSKNEEERLIRVWISEKGKELCLDILNHPIFKLEVNLMENQWYHICQSWSVDHGAWDLYFDGKLKSTGFVQKLQGIPIDGGGDIVVGQEYTDFDKGLDDGIEGNVFGFNFVLSSTSTPASKPIKFRNQLLRRRSDGIKFKPHPHAPMPLHSLQTKPIAIRRLHGGQSALDSRRIYPIRRRFARNIFRDMVNLFDAEVQASRLPLSNRFNTRIPVHLHGLTDRITSNEITSESPKSLGMLLVELSYDCGFKKGAPLSGSGVLISWTKSPVRVFGGAVLKKVPPFCKVGEGLLHAILD